MLTEPDASITTLEDAHSHIPVDLMSYDLGIEEPGDWGDLQHQAARIIDIGREKGTFSRRFEKDTLKIFELEIVDNRVVPIEGRIIGRVPHPEILLNELLDSTGLQRTKYRLLLIYEYLNWHDRHFVGEEYALSNCPNGNQVVCYLRSMQQAR